MDWLNEMDASSNLNHLPYSTCFIIACSLSYKTSNVVSGAPTPLQVKNKMTWSVFAAEADWLFLNVEKARTGFSMAVRQENNYVHV